MRAITAGGKEKGERRKEKGERGRENGGTGNGGDRSLPRRYPARSRTTGILNASFNRKPSSSRQRFEIGDEAVGEVVGLRPTRVASSCSRSIWNGSLTSTTRFTRRSRAHSATERIELRVDRPSGRTTMAASGTPLETR